MRLPLAQPFKTRTGAPDKDARLKNCYVETKGDPNNPETAVRKRPIAQGGVSVGTGTAQGGIGFYIGSTPYFVGVWGDTLVNYTGNGTNWDSGTTYPVGSMVSVGFVNYWAINENTNSEPPSADWSSSYVPAVANSYSISNGVYDNLLTTQYIQSSFVINLSYVQHPTDPYWGILTFSFNPYLLQGDCVQIIGQTELNSFTILSSSGGFSFNVYCPSSKSTGTYSCQYAKVVFGSGTSGIYSVTLSSSHSGTYASLPLAIKSDALASTPYQIIPIAVNNVFTGAGINMFPPASMGGGGPIYVNSLTRIMFDNCYASFPTSLGSYTFDTGTGIIVFSEVSIQSANVTTTTNETLLPIGTLVATTTTSTIAYEFFGITSP